MIKLNFSKHGAIGILTMLILGMVLVVMAVTVILTDISARTNALLLTKSEELFIGMEGCAEEALIQLSRNHDYAGGSFSFNGADCVVTVAGSGDTRDVSVTGTQDSFSHDLLIQISFAPAFHITQWTD